MHNAIIRCIDSNLLLARKEIGKNTVDFVKQLLAVDAKHWEEGGHILEVQQIIDLLPDASQVEAGGVEGGEFIAGELEAIIAIMKRQRVMFLLIH